MNFFSSRFLLLNKRSLVGRFFIASLCVLPLFIILNGTLLLNSFTHSQVNAEKENLQAHIYLLLGLTEIENNQATLPQALPEPRFNQQNSGLYATISDESNELLWQSKSSNLVSISNHLPKTQFLIDQLNFFSVEMLEQRFNVLSYDIEWIDDNDNIYPLRFTVLKDSAAIDAEINSYRKRLWQWLGLLSVGLLLLQALIMYWGLRPLKRLSHQLQELQQHKIQTLNKNYPHEIQPVIDNLNTILKQEAQQRERYRNSLADLAHSLKTPLTVINSQLSKNKEKDNTVEQQLHRIDQIITHQLQRAVIRSQKNSINQRGEISVLTITDRLISFMQKAHQNKQIEFINLTRKEDIFIGDEADILEILGNLMDNACKYGHNKILITSETRDNELIISISDNGEGVPETQEKLILQRGARADTAQIGQGIGLAVAIDIVSSYGGKINIENNASAPHLSGACFQVLFFQ